MLWAVSLLICLGFGQTLAVDSARLPLEVRVPRLMVLYLNARAARELPLEVVAGEVSPREVDVRVAANTDWVLWVECSGLFGAGGWLPPERVRLGGRSLGALPQPLAQGKGSAAWRYRVEVELHPAEREGSYRGVLVFNLAEP